MRHGNDIGRQAEDIVARSPHPYQSDPHSGAGNCWCGAGERAPIHQEGK